MANERILVVDDERGVRSSLCQLLASEGYETEDAEDGEACLARVRGGGIALVLLDVKMPGLDGVETLKRLRTMSSVPVVMMSAHASIETAVEATKLGAHDFLEKGISDEKILLTVRNTIDFQRLADENLTLKEALERRWALVGTSPAVTALRATIERVAPSQGRVLITGENGTGKEVVARAIHRLSRRARGPFVKFNCAALPVDLAESELFGHEKGAFTGATRSRKGRFEQADGGTLLLDEIGDLKLELQGKLLRVLQEGEFERVGSDETRSVDVRVLAATNQDLEKARAEGRFREDLFFRLNVVPLHVPPLRERARDIDALVEHFLKLGAEDQDEAQPPKSFDRDALELLSAYAWPGNIRELKNLVDRALILVPGDRVTRADVRMLLPAASEPALEGSEGGDRSLKGLSAEYERRVILERLRAMDGNMTRTAEDLGLERSHLYKKMRILGIPRD